MTLQPPIDAMLARTLRSVRADEPAAWPFDPDEDEAHRGKIWARIDFHGIAVLLHGAIDRLDGWPDALLERIEEEARIAALWEATHAKAVSDVIGACAQAEIETVVMKGTALAYWLHDEPAARRRGDSDILVRPGDLARTRQVLRLAGWQRGDSPLGLNRQEVWLKRRAEFFDHAIDLHWAPSDNHSLRRLLSLDDCFAHRQPLPRLHAHAFRPDAAFQIVHATINQGWHAVRGYGAGANRTREPRRLIWSVDFDLLVQALDAEESERLVRTCDDTGAGPLVAEALRGACRDLGTEPPPALIARLERRPLDPVLAKLFHDHDTISEFWLDWRAAPGWRERARMLAERALPPREHLEGKYPAQANWPVAALRVRFLASALRRTALRAGNNRASP